MGYFCGREGEIVQDQSGVSADTILAADVLVGGAVDLGDLEGLGGVSELVPHGGEALAVSAPRGVAGLRSASLPEKTAQRVGERNRRTT